MERLSKIKQQKTAVQIYFKKQRNEAIKIVNGSVITYLSINCIYLCNINKNG